MRCGGGGVSDGQHQQQGRRLQWLLHLCKGELRAGCFAKPYIFIASTAQIALLTVRP